MKPSNAITLDLNVGDIVYASWGYEQTNIDFYQVVRKTAKRYFVREIKSAYTETGFMSGENLPVIDAFKSEEIMATPYKCAPCLKIGRDFAYPLEYQEIDGVKVYKKQRESHYA